MDSDNSGSSSNNRIMQLIKPIKNIGLLVMLKNISIMIETF